MNSCDFNRFDTNEPRVAVRERLLDLMSDQSAFISTGGQIYMHFKAFISGATFAAPFDSPFLAGWLTTRASRDNQFIPSDSQIRQALRIREAGCHGSGTRNYRSPVHLRYAWNPHQSAFVLALDTEKGLHAAVTRDGWSVRPTPSTFIYEPIQQPIPEPVQAPNTAHDALLPLRKLLHLEAAAHDDTFQTLVDWALTAMRAPKNPEFHSYPILNLMSSDDNAKSVTARLLTQLLDPTLTPVHSLPTTERRLHSLAATHHILTFEDTGKINPEKSRYLSRLAGGVTSLHRKLQGMLVRPIILTTTDETESRHLATRVVDVELPPNPDDPDDIVAQFEALRPQLLGALLTLLVGTFLDPLPHLPNRRTKIQKIEESVTSFVAGVGGQWTGTVTDLLHHLDITPPVSTKFLSQFLDDTTAVLVTRKRRNDARLVQISSRAPKAEPTPAAVGQHGVLRAECNSAQAAPPPVCTESLLQQPNRDNRKP